MLSRAKEAQKQGYYEPIGEQERKKARVDLSETRV